MRTLVIGDIHSGLRALLQVMERGKVTSKDHLIFLGDYVDGWSEAVETVNFLLHLKSTHKCTFLRGNHDELCCDWLMEAKDNILWERHGGLASMRSYALTDNKTREKHIQFFQGLKNYHLDAQNRLFIHAGFTNFNGVDYEYFSKTFYWDRTLWETALALDPTMPSNHILFPKRLTLYKEVYIGHTPVTRIGKTEPFKAAGIWNVDTGAAFRGPLSLVNVDTKEIWQSDPVHLLYPGENGRNVN